MGGWWPLHRAPEDALQRVARADAVYVSHYHSDHCNRATLEALVKLNPATKVSQQVFHLFSLTTFFALFYFDCI